MTLFITKPKSMMTFIDGDRPGHYANPDNEYSRLIHESGYLEDAMTQWLVVKGSDATSFLQGMFTLDVMDLPIGSSRPSFALNPMGKIQTYLHIYRQDDGFILGCAPGYALQLKQHLERYIIMEQVTLSLEPDWFCLALIGPKIAPQVVQILDTTPLLQFRRTRAEVPSIDCILPKHQAIVLVKKLREKGLAPIGWQAYNTARIEAFEPWFPQDISPNTNPVIYGLTDAISAKKGCYIGQETVAMTRDRGRPPYVLTLLHSDGEPDQIDHIELQLNGISVGHSHSQCASPKYDSVVRLGVVKFKILAEALTHLTDKSGRCWQIHQFSELSES